MISTIHEIEWHVLEDEGREDAEWPPLVANEQPQPQWVTVPQLQHLYELLFLTVAFFGVAAGLLWHRADQRIAQLETELTALSDTLAQAQLPSVVDSRSINGTSALRNNGAPAYIFEGEYLRFETSADLAALVESVVRLSETSYRKLRQELDLSMTAPEAKITLVVGLGARSLEGNPDAIILSHPANAAKYYAITEVDAITSDIFKRLSIHLLREAHAQRRIKAPWQPIVQGFYLYWTRENGYATEWKLDGIHLTRRHKAQEQSIDTVLIGANREPDDDQWLAHYSPTDDVVDPLIEYILVTYGNSSIPLLLDGFSEHANWETLTPAVFGISAAEFEDAWHGYLRDMYPLPEQ